MPVVGGSFHPDSDDGAKMHEKAGAGMKRL